MSILMSVLLGVIHGITEIIPVSSSGHIAALQTFINSDFTRSGSYLLDALLHLGTLIAVLLVYRKEIKAILQDTGDFILKRGDEGRETDGRMKPSLRMFALVLLGTLPIIVVPLIYKYVESLFMKVGFIAFAFIVTGALLFASDRLPAGRKNEKNFRFSDALLVGLAQIVAAIPGLSRTGVTTAVSIARGCSRDFAARYSMLLSVPALLGSFLYYAIKALRAGIEWSLVPTYLIGMVIAAVISIPAIVVYKKLVASAKLGKLAYYCVAAGLVTVIFSLILL